MNNNKILQQFHAMFGVFMVVFYLGVAILFLFFKDLLERVFSINNDAILNILGGTFLLYGMYRVYVTYKQIVAAFFSKDNDRE
jgi:hypothetical protein